jgi:thiol-disulfide isomerase/thioredoxin
MTFHKILIVVAVFFGLSAGAYAKNEKQNSSQSLTKEQRAFVDKLGRVKGNIKAKEIKEGFVFESGKGKVTMLILWTKDCKSCVADIPKLNRILLDFKGKVNIIAIELSGMSSKELQKYVREKKVLYTMISGVENKKFTSKIMDKFGFKKSLPFQIVLGYTGHNNGIIKGISKLKDMEKYLAKIIEHYEGGSAAKHIIKQDDKKGKK